MITLTSDFGLKDPYVAEMKAAILTINSKATIIDITHEVEKFKIRQAAFVLASAVPYFPEDTVHLAVVDPGVGTQRRAIIVKAKKTLFVGPDNGILVLAAQKQGIERVHELTNPKFMLSKISNTFHGRDVFAPAAAYLNEGVRPEEFGLEVKDFVNPEFVKIKKTKSSMIGEILHIDGFGNIITNIKEKDITGLNGQPVTIEFSKTSLKLPLAKTYGEAKPKEALALTGSHGFIEIALNQGNAAKKYHAKVGEKIKVAAY